MANMTISNQLFAVKKALHSLQQEGRMFKEVFCDFTALWSKLENLRPPTASVEELKKRQAQDQVFGLLLSLDDTYRDLITNLLTQAEFPTLKEVCMAIEMQEGDVSMQKGHLIEKGGELIMKPSLDAVIKTNPKNFKFGMCYMMGRSSSAWNNGSNREIVVDSGASFNMIADRNLLSNVTVHSGNIFVANGESVRIMGKGDIYIFGRRTKAYYVPSMVKNLLSVSNLTRTFNCKAIFNADTVLFQDNVTNDLIGQGWLCDRLYLLGGGSVVAGAEWGLSAT